MTNRYEKIRKALEMRPTPGPWEVINGTDVFTPLGARNAAGVEAAADDGWHVADCDMGPSFTEEGKENIPYVGKQANAALIAACDPDTIRELLDERDALAAEVERLHDLWRCTVCGRVGTVGRCCGEETRERVTMEQLLAENERLRDEVERLRSLAEALEALGRAHQTAMEQTLKARMPECAEFAGIAQDLDFVVAALRERLGSTDGEVK